MNGDPHSGSRITGAAYLLDDISQTFYDEHVAFAIKKNIKYTSTKYLDLRKEPPRKQEYGQLS